MPLNLLKFYNQLLDLYHLRESDNLRSIRAVFDRDFPQFPITFRNYSVHPTPAEAEDTMDRVFRHLTTVIVDKAIRKRQFDAERSVRIHWVRYHLEEKKPDVIEIFTIENESRVYVVDFSERYVVVLEPLRKQQAFFLLTAYPLESSRYRNLMNRIEKRGKKGITVWD